jgi:hypothetical protein
MFIKYGILGRKGSLNGWAWKARKRWNLGATLPLLSRVPKLTQPRCVPQEVLLVMRSG